MKPARCLRVGTELASLAINLARELEVILNVVLKVVGIDEVTAGVIGRIDVDQLDLAGIALLQELEHFEIITLDHEVLGGIPIDALLRARAKRAGGGGQRDLAGVALAVPVEAILHLTLI